MTKSMATALLTSYLTAKSNSSHHTVTVTVRLQGGECPRPQALLRRALGFLMAATSPLTVLLIPSHRNENKQAFSNRSYSEASYLTLFSV